MSDLENELRVALRRRAAPEGFAERVVNRVQSRRRPQSGWRQWAVAASLTLAVGIGGLQYDRGERRQREGEEAKEALVTALGIAGSKLAYAQSKVIRSAGPSRKDRI